MKFSTIAAISSFAVFAQAAMTATELADSLSVLASKTYAIRPIVQSINGTVASATHISQGPILDVIMGFEDLSSTMLANIPAMSHTENFTDEDDENLILTQYDDFVQGTEELLDALKLKAPLINSIIGSIITGTTKQLAGIELAYLTNVVALLPDFDTQTHYQKNLVEQHFTLTEATFNAEQ